MDEIIEEPLDCLRDVLETLGEFSAGVNLQANEYYDLNAKDRVILV